MTTRKRVDLQLNVTTLKLFASAFMASAFCAVLAVFVIVLGQVYASAQGSVVQASVREPGPAHAQRCPTMAHPCFKVPSPLSPVLPPALQATPDSLGT
eukprot:scaffold821_cov100-Isochrysis_galbana.AAC.3